MQIHVVEPGDTLSYLSSTYGLPISKIMTDNNLDDPSAISVGQALLIAKPVVSDTVRQGDDIYSIAARNHVEVTTLLQNNPEFANRSPRTGEIVALDYGEQKNYSLAVLGYTYDYIDIKTLRAALPYLTYLAVFGYGFTPTGGVTEVNDSWIIEEAHLRGVKVLLSITTITDSGAFDNPYTELLLSQPDFTDRVINRMMEIITEKGADGLDIDMEYIPPNSKEGFIRFVRRAADACHARGYILNVALAPKNYAEQPGVLYEAHDYRAIGEYADTVFLMTYEWGYKYGPPMAVAPLPNVRRVLEYALTEIPASKILLGIPNYGYDWKLPFVQDETVAESISNVEAAARAKRMNTEILYDNTSRSPFYYYNVASSSFEPYSAQNTYGNRDSHVVWFEDVRSVREKFSLAADKRIYGIGYWSLMYPFAQNYLYLAGFYGIIKV
ncbi:MAG: LysM peptidoglycan-binding domain-containing protein [Ruminococcus sp.]|jgi:spore germination protein|nr:LysM peptidoglycan-binding domain-containing protein [Ruminococcus sp.]